MKPVPVKTCECCGHPVPEYNTLRGLTPGQQRLFHALEEAGQAGLSRVRLFDALYGHRTDGGPSAIGVLNVQRAKMQHVLREHGVKIVTVPSSYGAVWRLEKL